MIRIGLALIFLKPKKVDFKDLERFLTRRNFVYEVVKEGNSTKLSILSEDSKGIKVTNVLFVDGKPLFNCALVSKKKVLKLIIKDKLEELLEEISVSEGAIKKI